MKKLLIIISFLIIIMGLNGSIIAQPQYYNYNTDGSGSNSFPFNVAAGKLVQNLYLPGDFNQPSPAPSGTITSVAFKMSSTSPLVSRTYTNFTIKMGLTNITSLPTGSFYAGTLTTVYFRASITFSSTANWLTITLDTPFTYDNTQSLVVEAECCSMSGGSGGSVSYTGTPVNRRNYSGATSCPYTYLGVSLYVYHFGINLSAAPTGILQGTVTNSVNGTPIAGASITVNALPAVLTNGAGFYTVPNVPAGTANINATATGYQPYTGTATIVAGQTTTKNFTMIPLPAYLTGYITNAGTSAPVHGARISVGATYTYSLPNGYYYFQAFPAGSQTVTVEKPGYITSTATVNIVPNSTTTYNVALQVTAYPPGPVTAALNGTSTAVDINWSPPSGQYEIIYDDGGQENWTVWSVAGNMNAMKFTPITGGVSVMAGKVNIGTAANYAAGTDPTLLAPFQIAVYDATGPGGTPGVQIGATIDVLPANFGWNVFTFPTPINVTGTFYLVMIQGGTPPNAAGLAVDETTNNLRSYSHFGAGPWLPASGNYMLRAVVTGQGGPLDIDVLAPKTEITANAIEGLIYDHTPASVTGVEGNAVYQPFDVVPVIPYTVWRLLEGQEGNEALWGAPIASNITGTSTVDNGWPSLPDGPYRWAVKAGYPVNRLSPPTFSNVIGKNWTTTVTVNVSLTCAVTPVAGAIVKLQNTAFSQYVYTATVTSTGTVNFPAVWKGTYDLTVTKIGYDPYLLAAQTIMGPMTFDVILLQQRLAPSNMFVNNKSLIAIWNAPVGLGYPLFEDWASGNFTTNNWTAEAVWAVNTGFGNPAPTAEFYYYPTLTNYSRSLTSKTLTGTGAPDFKLMYDIYLSDYLGDGNEQLDVELSIAGGAWTTLKHYANQGSINWTTETIDIASVGSQNFQIRFRAHGSNSYNINNWDFDNIKIRSVAPDPKPCILAYNIYLNGIFDGVTQDTTYQIPPSHVFYGTVYTACVRAVYGSGYSGPSCYTFTSKYLYPPTNLQATAVECAVYLTWEKPGTKKILSMTPRTSIPNASTDYAPYICTTSDPGNSDNIDALWDVLFAWPVIPASGAGGGQVGVEVDGNYLYTSVWGGLNTGPPWFAKYDITTGALIEAFNIPGVTAIRDLAFDGTYFYGGAITSTIYKMDFTTKTLIGTISTSVPSIRHIAYDPVNNGFWCGGWYDMYLVNASTGATIATGPAQTSAYGSAYDPDPTGPFLWVHAQNGSPLDEVEQFKITGTTLTSTGITHNMGYIPGFPAGASVAGGLCATDVGNKFALVGITQAGNAGTANLVWAVELRAGGGPPPGGVGLLGYNIYRDGPLVHFVGDPDTLFWYDFTVEPGVHSYQVSAYYELTAYGYPGQHDESMLEGPAEIDLECGIELPFYEPWTNGSFGFQNWTLSPATTNWSVNANVGNPAPSADFSWEPIQYNYSLSLVTPVLNGGPFTCSMIWCDFDYKLIDRNMTGDEKLYVDVFFKGSWKNKAEFSNTGNKDWTPMHLDISEVKGKAFKVRFRAEGANSADILHWYVDNVNIYAKCNPPINLTNTSQIGYEVTLTWSKPVCGASGPEPQWIHWDDGTNSTSIGTGGAVDFYCAARWDASQIVALDGGAVTKIAFYPASAGTGDFRIRVWEGPDAATMLVDQAVPTVTWDAWNIIDVAAPVPIDITKELWIGYDINATGGWPAGCDAGPAVVGYGDMIYFTGAWASMYTAYGLNYNWNIQGYVEPADDHATSKKVMPLVQNINYKSGGTLSASGLPSLNTTKFNPGDNGGTDSQTLLGYNIYRSDDNKVTYNKLNATMLTDTNYVDVLPNGYQVFYYYVTSIFSTYPSETCESDSSNVEPVVPIGIDPLNGGRISIYPNPVRDNVIVKSDFTITNVEVLNYIGQTVYSRQDVSEKTLKVNVANLTAGIYFVKATTIKGTKTVKITVTK